MKKKLAMAFFFSGAAALVYQVLWVRMLGLVFGNTTYAISTVLAAFMGGMALGSWLLGRYADKPGFRPVRALALIEAGIGAYCALSPLLFSGAAKVYILAQQGDLSLPAVTLLRFLLSSAILLLPTALMGGTLPVMTRALKTLLPEGELPRAIGLFYGVNTAGAVSGVIFAAFFAIAALGVSATLALAVGLNLAVGALLFRLAAGEKTAAPAPEETFAPVLDLKLARTALAAAAVAGFASMICEVVWTRSLSMVIGMSVYAFSVMLAAFLTGIAAGSFLFARYLENLVEGEGKEAFLAIGVILGSVGVVILTTIPAFNHLPLLFLRLFKLMSGSYAGLLAVQALFSFIVMAVPAALFGLMFPALIKIYSQAASAAKTSAAVGRVYAFNTAGCIAGSLLAGFALISLLGLEGSIRASGFVCVASALVILFLADFRRLALPVAGFLLLASAPHLLAVGSWDRAVMNSGVYQYAPDIIASAASQGIGLKDALKQAISSEELYYRTGSNFSVAVTRGQGGLLSLSIDGKVDASSDISLDMQTQALSGHLPLLLHPGARKVLVIGLASGVTLGAVAAYPVEEIDCVEIEPSMAEAAAYFSQWNGSILKDKRVRLIVNDGRNYLKATKKKYDVIISVPSNPWIPGSAALFTKDFFELAKNSLAAGGVFCQWMQMYEVRLGEVRSVAAAAAGVFPGLSLWNPVGGDLLLVSAGEKFNPDYAGFSKRFAAVAPALAGLRIKDPLDILSRFLLAGAELEAFVGGSRPNTDNRPVLEFSAPKYVYTAEAGGANLAGLQKIAVSVSSYLAGFGDNAGLAERYLARGLPAQAEKEAARMLAVKPSGPAHNLLGEAYLAQGRTEDAAGQFRAALAFSPENRKYLVNFSAAVMEKDPDQALALAGKAKGAEAYTQTGLVYLKKGDPASAAKAFEKARQADPSYMPAYINGAVVYLDYLDVPPAALEIADAGIRLNRNRPELYYHAGRALYRMGLAREALENFNMAAAMNPAYGKPIKEEVEKVNGAKG